MPALGSPLKSSSVTSNVAAMSTAVVDSVKPAGTRPGAHGASGTTDPWRSRTPSVTASARGARRVTRPLTNRGAFCCFLSPPFKRLSLMRTIPGSRGGAGDIAESARDSLSRVSGREGGAGSALYPQRISLTATLPQDDRGAWGGGTPGAGVPAGDTWGRRGSGTRACLAGQPVWERNEQTFCSRPKPRGESACADGGRPAPGCGRGRNRAGRCASNLAPSPSPRDDSSAATGVLPSREGWLSHVSLFCKMTLVRVSEKFLSPEDTPKP